MEPSCGLPEAWKVGDTGDCWGKGKFSGMDPSCVAADEKTGYCVDCEKKVPTEDPASDPAVEGCRWPFRTDTAAAGL